MNCSDRRSPGRDICISGNEVNKEGNSIKDDDTEAKMMMQKCGDERNGRGISVYCPVSDGNDVPSPVSDGNDVHCPDPVLMPAIVFQSSFQKTIY